MSRDKDSLFDIQAACDDVAAFMRGKLEDDLHRDTFLRSAVLYQIAVIGEAVKRLSSEFCLKYPEIPWRHIASMRDRLIHSYDDVDVKIVWQTANEEIPKLSDFCARKTAST